MPKILIKTRLHSIKHKYKIKPELNNTKSILPPNLQNLNSNCYQDLVLLSVNDT